MAIFLTKNGRYPVDMPHGGYAARWICRTVDMPQGGYAAIIKLARKYIELN